MPLKQQCQSTQQVKVLQNILDIQLKICNILNIQCTDIQLQPLQFNLQGINMFKTILRKIYNRLLVNSSPIQKIQNSNDKSDIFQCIQQKQAYEQIQDLLQKQQNKNRTLLRKQFEFKEYQNTIIDELNDQKVINRKLNQQLNKLTEQLQQKTLEIMHLKNQTRAFQRGSKDVLNQDKSDTLNKNIYHSSLAAYGHLGNDLTRQDKKIATSRQKQYNKLNPKKSREIKQKALYALYNNHKKNHSQTINGGQLNSDKAKKGSVSQMKSAKKAALKDMNSIQFSNKKVIHGRRKSQQFYKKTPSQREGRQSKQLRKKRDEIIQRINF